MRHILNDLNKKVKLKYLKGSLKIKIYIVV